MQILKIVFLRVLSALYLWDLNITTDGMKSQVSLQLFWSRVVVPLPALTALMKALSGRKPCPL